MHILYYLKTFDILIAIDNSHCSFNPEVNCDFLDRTTETIAEKMIVR